MKRAAFYTLGCKLNFSETSTLARNLESHGYSKVSFEEAADVYVINTCSVTENADRECKKIVKDALKANPEAYVVVTGCFAQLKPEAVAGIPGVDLVLGAAWKKKNPRKSIAAKQRPSTLLNLRAHRATEPGAF
jgi:threonylcarbamoyladenosine tRNA methylthiotransferase MtaB